MIIKSNWVQRLKEAEGRRQQSDLTELKSQYEILKGRGTAIRQEIDSAGQQLAEFDSQQGQQQHKLVTFSKDTATAWKWVQENQGEFEKEVYGPPLIACSVKDPRYTAAVEAFLGKNDVLTLTAQTPNDFRKLQRHILGTMKLADVTIRSVSQSLDEVNRSPLSPDELKQCGLEGWALDFIDGPEPLLAMLCSSKKLSAAAVSLQDISEEQHHKLVNSACSSWVAGRYFNRVTRRAEYGPGATSTMTNIVKDPKWWTNAPIDTSARREIEMKITNLKQQLSELGGEAIPLKASITAALPRSREIKDEIVSNFHLIFLHSLKPCRMQSKQKRPQNRNLMANGRRCQLR